MIYTYGLLSEILMLTLITNSTVSLVLTLMNVNQYTMIKVIKNTLLLPQSPLKSLVLTII